MIFDAMGARVEWPYDSDGGAALGRPAERCDVFGGFVETVPAWVARG